MRTIRTLAVGVVLVGAMAGCGGPSADALAADQINTLNSMKDALDGIKDDASADAALPKLEAGAAHKKELDDKMAALKLSAEDTKKLMDARGADLMKAGMGVSVAATVAGMKAPKKAKAIQEALNKMNGKPPGK